MVIAPSLLRRYPDFSAQDPFIRSGRTAGHLVEPWPADWYYTDDVYIDYVDGGYYMYDPYYPGTRFAISVVL